MVTLKIKTAKFLFCKGRSGKKKKKKKKTESLRAKTKRSKYFPQQAVRQKFASPTTQA